MRNSTILKCIVFSLFAFAVFSNSIILAEENPPKNIIIFISDGMGFNHVTATNYYTTGKENSAIYESFPVKLGLATYSGFADKEKTFTLSYCSKSYWSDFEYAKKDATDSGAASTAMATGRKTFRAGIGVNVESQPVYNMTELFRDLGKSTGVITSVQFSHATPAGFVAHTLHRDNYHDIATQMIESNVDVIMSAANPYYDNNGDKLESPDFKFYGSESNWEKVKNNYNGRTFIENKEDFEKYANGNAPSKLFGAAKTATTLQQKRSGIEKPDVNQSVMNTNVPSLETMTLASLNALNNNQNGFFLMVEGGAVDWSGHDNHTGRMIEEMIDFNNSVEAAVKWIESNSNWDETLLIVTSDHECGYLTGPKPNDNNPITNPIINNGKGRLPEVSWNHTGHTNALVPFYAKGSNAEMLNKYAYEKDSIYGYFINNSDMPLAIFNFYNSAPRVIQLNQ